MPGALAGLGRYFSMNEVLNIKNDVEYAPNVDLGTATKGATRAVTIHFPTGRASPSSTGSSSQTERRVTAAHIEEGRNSVLTMTVRPRDASSPRPL